MDDDVSTCAVFSEGFRGKREWFVSIERGGCDPQSVSIPVKNRKAADALCATLVLLLRCNDTGSHWERAK